MLTSILGWSFFGLSSQFSKNLLDEIYYLIRDGFSYSDILIMPTYQRKYFLGKILERYDSTKE